MDLNRVCLTGRLTKDIKANYYNDKKVANFTIAVNNGKDNSGNDKANFINCVVWGKLAEILEQYTHKGDKLAIDGSISTRNYDNKEGQRIYITEVVVEKFTFLENKKEEKGSTIDYDQPLKIAENDLPFY